MKNELEFSKLEAKLRRQLSKLGYRLQKSRVKQIHGDNLGGYRILDIQTNVVVLGARFELSLDDVVNFVS